MCMKRNVFLILIALLVALTGFCSCNRIINKVKEKIGNKVEQVVVNEPVDSDVVTPPETEGVEMPSVQKIGMLFDNMSKNPSAITDYGFTLVDRQSKTCESDYDDGTTYEMFKETYTLNYRIYDIMGYMILTYVYAKEYGEPTMSIQCDSDSWKVLKDEAKTTLKHMVDNSYFLNNYSFISFPKKGQIEITTECSISW